MYMKEKGEKKKRETKKNRKRDRDRKYEMKIVLQKEIRKRLLTVKSKLSGAIIL